jgi:hypothetical protein
VLDGGIEGEPSDKTGCDGREDNENAFEEGHFGCLQVSGKAAVAERWGGGKVEWTAAGAVQVFDQGV